MSIFNSTINRVYKCEACNAVLQFEEKVSDDWKKKCPLCHKNKLYLDSAYTNISVFIDQSKPKTIGALADNNTKDREKEGTLPKAKRPPWRKKSRINYKILQNPSGYIEKGYV